VIRLKISWIKYEKDNTNFITAEKFGMPVYKIQNLEETDKKLQELVDENYNTIILSNEVAGFSEDIIKKYEKEKNVNIIISPRK
jgi:vacuolar-type H+-ATPase subunit F/Vma7